MIKMKKLTKKILCGALSAASLLGGLMLTGCGDGEKAADTSGAGTSGEKTELSAKTGIYAEELFDAPDLSSIFDTIGIFTDKNGETEYFGLSESNNTAHIRKVDGKWQQDFVDINKATNLGDDLCKMIKGEDGKYYLLIFRWGDSSVNFELHKLSDDFKTAENVTPASWKPNVSVSDFDSYLKNYINAVKVLSDGTIFYLTDRWNVYAPSTGDVETITDTSAASQLALCGNAAYFTNLDNSAICKYESGKSATEITDVKPTSDSFLLAASEKALFLVDSTGIHRFALDGVAWETVVDGNAKALSKSDIVYKDFAVYDDSTSGKESYFINIESGSGMTLNIADSQYLYRFNENAVVPDKIIKIYSLYENTSVRNAIISYCRENPSVSIEYATADLSGSATVSDIIRSLNTEILAGSGADIFLLDGLPIDSYIEKGVLEDLSDLLKPMADNKELVENVAKNYITDGKIYGMPVRFGVPLYVAQKDADGVFESLDKLTEYAKTSEKPVMYYSGKQSLFLSMLYTYYEKLLNEDGSINADEYKKFMESVEAIIATYGEDGGGDEYNGLGNNCHIDQIMNGDPIMLSTEKEKSIIQCVNSVEDMLTNYAIINEFDDVYGLINNTFAPNGIVGMNAACAEKEIAKDFIKYLFSEEQQNVNNGDGFPVNAAALKNIVVDTRNDDLYFSFGVSDDSGTSYKEISASWPTAEECTEFYEILLKAYKPVNNDEVLINMILSESMPVIDGSVTLDEAAENIVRKVNLYLSENS